MPSRLLEFQSGKAMLSPISRMARMVSVLATAQRQPARTAQIIKCGARRTSARTDEVPSINESEEHTSELQSPDHLVCRLLLEKKKDISESCDGSRERADITL